MNILDKIIAQKELEVARNKTLYPVALLEKSGFMAGKPVSMASYIQREDKTGIIAEFKRKSPSKGLINGAAEVEASTIAYMQAGASALSVLTDQSFFGGKNSDLSTARRFNFCPILRKDFIIDEYQIIEAKSIGADAILLIAAVLEPKRLQALARFAKSFGMEVLMEVHNEAELLNNLHDEIDLFGVNNRNLKTFEVSLETSKSLATLIPDEKVKVSESGISSVANIMELKEYGYSGFLMGENFMKHRYPGQAARAFCEQLTLASKSI